MAQTPTTPTADQSGLPVITKEDLQTQDPSRLNRVLRLLATQIQTTQQSLAALSTASATAATPAAQTITGNQISVTTQSGISVLISKLTAGDFIFVSDYSHWLYWNGSGLSFADDGSDYYALGQRSSGSLGWHAVDGSTVSFLKSDGTLGSRVLVNVAAQKTFLSGGSGADTLNAAVAPGITGSPALTGAPQVNDSTGFAGSSGSPVGVVTAINSVTAGTLAVNAGTLAANTSGVPENFYSVLWFRQ